MTGMRGTEAPQGAHVVDVEHGFADFAAPEVVRRAISRSSVSDG